MQQFTHVWWVLDPQDKYSCCPGCQRMAANSPYTRPGRGGMNREVPQETEAQNAGRAARANSAINHRIWFNGHL